MAMKVIDVAKTGSALLIKFKGFKNDDEWIEPVSNAVQAADSAKFQALAEAKAEDEAETEAEDEGDTEPKLNKV